MIMFKRYGQLLLKMPSLSEDTISSFTGTFIAFFMFYCILSSYILLPFLFFIIFILTTESLLTHKIKHLSIRNFAYTERMILLDINLKIILLES